MLLLKDIKRIKALKKMFSLEKQVSFINKTNRKQLNHLNLIKISFFLNTMT